LHPNKILIVLVNKKWQGKKRFINLLKKKVGGSAGAPSKNASVVSPKKTEELPPSNEKNSTIIYYLKKLWNNVKLLRFITILSAIITVLLGSKDIYLLQRDYFKEKDFNKLYDISVYVPFFNADSYNKWVNKVEKFRNEEKFKDGYNLLKGLSLCVPEDLLFADVLSPDYYLKRVSPDSKYFPTAISGRASYYLKAKDTALRQSKIKHLIDELTDLQYIKPYYFFLQYKYAEGQTEGQNEKLLINYYKNFKVNYRFATLTDTITLRVGQSSLFNAVTMCEVSALDYLYTVHFYTTTSNDSIKMATKELLVLLAKQNDDNLLGLKYGLDQLGELYPFCLETNYPYMRDSKSEWLIFEKRTLEKLLEGKYKLIPNL